MGIGRARSTNRRIDLVGPSPISLLRASRPAASKFRNGSVVQRTSSISLISPSPATAIERYYGYDRPIKDSLKREFDTKRKARYGLTWRGIKRPHDREMGIAGGELIVLDLETNEVLAVRRGYALYAGQWQLTPACPKYGYEGGWDKFGSFTYWFVGKVVRPPRWKESFDRLEKTRRPRAEK